MRVLSFLFDLVRKLHKKGAMGFSLQFNTVKLEAKFLQVFKPLWQTRALLKFAQYILYSILLVGLILSPY